MKYSVLGFSQDAVCGISKIITGKDGKSKIIELDITDLLIIQELADFMNRKSVIKHTINDKMYFSVKYDAILEDLPILGIKKQALRDRIDKICELGVIEKYIVRNDTGSWTAFRLGDVYEDLKYRAPLNQEGVCIPLQGGVYQTTHPCVADYTPNNYTTITKEEKDTKVSKKKNNLDMSIVSPDMLPVVELWLNYKKEKRQSYKHTGFITFYRKLCEMSDNNPNVAMQIVETSMQNNYAGLFSQKDNTNTIINKYPKSVNDIKDKDNKTTLNGFMEWAYKNCQNLWNNLKGFPEKESQFKYMIDHTEGGSKALCYVTLVLNRDGWEKYNDERGFMAIYGNYIKANGMFKE